MSTILDPKFAHSPYANFTRWLKSVVAQARERCPFLDNNVVPGGSPGQATRLGLWGLPEVSPDPAFELAVKDRALNKRDRLSLDNPRLTVADDAGAGTIAIAKADHDQRCDLVTLARTEYTALTAAVLASLPPHWQQKYIDSPDASRTVASIILDMTTTYSDMPADIRRELEDRLHAPFPPEAPIAVALAEFDSLLDSLPAGIRARYDPARLCELALEKFAAEPAVQSFLTDTILVQHPIAATRDWETDVRPLLLTLVDQKRLAVRPLPTTTNGFAAYTASTSPRTTNPILRTSTTRPHPPRPAPTTPRQWCAYHAHCAHSTRDCTKLVEKGFSAASHPELWHSTGPGTYNNQQVPIAKSLRHHSPCSITPAASNIA